MIPIDEVVHFDVITSTPATGAAVDADSAPTFSVFEEATDTPILSAQTMTKRTSLTGNYRGTFTASAANGFEAGKWYSVVASAVVGGVTGKCIAKNFRIAPAETAAGVPKVDTSHWDGTAVASAVILAAANIASGAFTAAKFAAGALDAVWSTTTRLLTAGTNIVLAKGTGVTGLNDLDAAGVRTAVGLASANLDTQLADLPTVAELDAEITSVPAAVLAAAAAAPIAANVKEINDVTMTGDGTSGDKWRPLA